MLKYFPFGTAFDAGMGASALQAPEALVDVDLPHYAHEIALKRLLLSDHPDEYYRGGEALLEAQWEVLERVLYELAGHYPQRFTLERSGHEISWTNDLLQERTDLVLGETTSLPVEPLDWVGRQVQEDLVLVSADMEAVFVGGQLCFPSGWDIKDRISKPFMGIHATTPQTTMRSVHSGARMLASMKPGKTIWRLSWNFKLSDQLDLSTKHKPAYKADFASRAPTLTAETAGHEVFIRIERQTLTRLARSPFVLFGIHTYNSRLAEEARDKGRARNILNVIRTTPEDVKRYKAIAPIEGALTGYLEQQLQV